jgi:uncharacterized protein
METPDLLKDFRQNAQRRKEQNLLFLKKISSKNNRKIDDIAEKLHDEAFEKIDCRDCGNCCKTTSPRFNTADIRRISAHVGLSESAFEQKYLQFDEDGDRVVKTLPCPFLDADNACSIYEVRPKDCQEYPHTNKKAFAERVRLNHNNTLVCPVAFYIVEKMRKMSNLA